MVWGENNPIHHRIYTRSPDEMTETCVTFNHPRIISLLSTHITHRIGIQRNTICRIFVNAISYFQLCFCVFIATVEYILFIWKKLSSDFKPSEFRNSKTNKMIPGCVKHRPCNGRRNHINMCQYRLFECCLNAGLSSITEIKLHNKNGAVSKHDEWYREWDSMAIIYNFVQIKHDRRFVIDYANTNH